MHERRRNTSLEGANNQHGSTAGKNAPPTLLLVDDEEYLRDVGKQFLVREGYRVLAAASGEEALEIFDRQPEIDLVILDLGLPGMSGSCCLKELRKSHPELCVLVASGYADPLECEKAMAMGAGGFLGKPFRREELLNAVGRLLGTRVN